MNVACALQHFCDLHGPQILLCTETRPYIHSGTDQVNDNLRILLSQYFQTENLGEKIRCKSCELSTDSFVVSSIDFNKHLLFISSSSTPNQQLYKIIRNACVRSLNIEKPAENDYPVMFGDEENGYCLSIIFSCKDFHARGSQRLYSLCYLSDDKYHLLSLMNMISAYMREIIRWIQSDANHIYEQEGHIRVHSKQSGTSKTSSVVRPPPSISIARMLPEMVQDSRLIYRIHILFVWLLRTAHSAMHESLFDAPPTEDQTTQQERKETYDYFLASQRKRTILETTANVTRQTLIFLDSTILNESLDLFSNSINISNDEDDDFDSLQYQFSSYGYGALKIFRQFIIKLKNQNHLEYCLYNWVIGNPLIIKYRNLLNDKDFLRAFVSVLRLMIPDGCFNLVETNEEKSCQNANLILIDMNSSKFDHHDEKSNGSSIIIRLIFDQVDDFVALACIDSLVPSKFGPLIPSYVKTVIEILMNPKVDSDSFDAMITQQKIKYLNKAKIYFQLGRCQIPSSLCRNEHEQFEILQLNNISDLPMIRFWQKGISNSYKTHIRMVKLNENQEKQRTHK